MVDRLLIGRLGKAQCVRKLVCGSEEEASRQNNGRQALSVELTWLLGSFEEV